MINCRSKQMGCKISTLLLYSSTLRLLSSNSVERAKSIFLKLLGVRFFSEVILGLNPKLTEGDASKFSGDSEPPICCLFIM